MRTSQKTLYHCEICDDTYATAKEALACEKKSIEQDRGAKAGDVVIITRGQSTGKKATVTKRWIYNKGWGHYAWERYWHTVGICAEIVDSPYSRQLTFDDYELETA